MLHIKLSTLFGILPLAAIFVTGCAADTTDTTEAPADEVVADGEDESDVGTTRDALVAPSCVATSLNAAGYTDHVRIQNNCKTDKRLKVNIRWRRDSSCFTLSPGQYKDVSWVWPGAFNGVETC